MDDKTLHESFAFLYYVAMTLLVYAYLLGVIIAVLTV